MTDEQVKMINNLREQGIGYRKIAKVLGISDNTVKHIFSIHPSPFLTPITGVR
jgi:transcriptional regulator